MGRNDSGLPIIAVTADILDKQIVEEMSVKGNGYLVKPYSIEDILIFPDSHRKIHNPSLP